MAANQSTPAISTNVYAVATPQPTVYLQNPAGPSQKAILAVTNMDLTTARVVTLTPLPKTPNTTATLTALSPTKHCGPANHCGQPTVSQRRLPARPEPANQPPETRRFVVHTGGGPFNDPRFFHAVPARCVGFNECVAVFAHPAADAPTGDSVQQLLKVFTQQHELVANLFGTRAVDVDGDGRFCVLLVPKPARTLPTAFVRPADFTNSASSDLSNAADMLYLSCQQMEPQQLRTLITHEYAHAICCSLRPEIMEDDWLHEAIAHLTEHLCGSSPSNVDHRISRFFENTHRYPLVVPDYFAANLYREHGCRGATATFLTSANRHHSGVDRFIQKLANSPTTGIQNITAATETRFPAITRRWTQDLLKTKPHTLGEFVVLGPKPTPLNDKPLRVSVAPTATLFVELSGPAYELTTEGTRPSQATIHVTSAQSSLPITSLTHSNGDIEISIACPHQTQRVVCGAEMVVNGRSTSLGLREAPEPTEPATFRFKPRSPSRGPITIKAFAELADGTVLTGRKRLPPAPVQLTVKPVTLVTQ